MPLVGVGGILNADDAVQYFRAGASLIQIGTASFAHPRASEKLVRGLARWGRRHGVSALSALVPPPPVPEDVNVEPGPASEPSGFQAHPDYSVGALHTNDADHG